MNIQIFGSKKDNDTKKAQRFFKERGIRFQYIAGRKVHLLPSMRKRASLMSPAWAATQRRSKK